MTADYDIKRSKLAEKLFLYLKLRHPSLYQTVYGPRHRHKSIGSLQVLTPFSNLWVRFSSKRQITIGALDSGDTGLNSILLWEENHDGYSYYRCDDWIDELLEEVGRELVLEDLANL